MKNDSPLVTTQWLSDHLEQASLRVIDIRGRVLPASEPPPHYHSHHEAYEKAHIPGAVFVDWTTDIVEPGSPSYDIANPQRYADLMAQLGIDGDTVVVAYDDADGMFAARMWWTLHYYGHAEAYVLDGGWQKWLAEDRPVTAAIPVLQPAIFVPQPQPAIHSDAQRILASGAEVALLDVRSPAEFAGEASRATRKGRIEGAVNVPRKVLVAQDGTMLPAEQLRQTFVDAGLNLEASEIIAYCNSGVSASYGLLALRVLGYPAGRVYDGSWKEWGNDPSKPIT